MGIELPELELVAEQVHETWCETKRSQGITSRKTEDGVEQMVPWVELPESVKETNRDLVRTVYAAVLALGD